MFHVFVAALAGPGGVEALDAACAVEPAPFVAWIVVSVTVFAMAFEILTPIYSNR